MLFTEILHESIGHSMKEVSNEEAGFGAASSLCYVFRAIQVHFERAASVERRELFFCYRGALNQSISR